MMAEGAAVQPGTGQATETALQERRAAEEDRARQEIIPWGVAPGQVLRGGQTSPAVAYPNRSDKFMEPTAALFVYFQALHTA